MHDLKLNSACVHACVRACVRACVCLCVRACKICHTAKTIAITFTRLKCGRQVLMLSVASCHSESYVPVASTPGQFFANRTPGEK